MIKLQGHLPRCISVAVSGGVDSMAALDFLRRNHTVRVMHFNHDADNADEAEDLVVEYCNKHNIEYLVGHLRSWMYEKPQGMSQEEYWREARYRFLDSGNPSIVDPVITCHHLDDCVETWIWSSLHGESKLIPYRRNVVIRPFRLTRKRDFELWAAFNNVPYVHDTSNNNLNYTRNYIRNEMMPHVLRVNPGIYKTVQKKVKDKFMREQNEPALQI